MGLGFTMAPRDRTVYGGIEMGEKGLDPEEIPRPIAILKICVNNCESFNRRSHFR